MKKRQATFLKAAQIAMLALSVSSVNLFAEDTSIKNYDNFSVEREFTGTVTPLTVNTLRYGFNDEYRGTIFYTPTVGTIFEGPITDLNKKIIKQGTPLIKIDTQYREARVKKSEANLERTKADFEMKKADFERYSKLIRTNSVSKQVYEQTQSDFLISQDAVAAAECDLILSKDLLEICTYYAQFDGIVSNVMMSAGYCAGEPSIMEITQLYPIGIKVNMNRTLANQITISTPITVYPDPSISKEAIGIANELNLLNADGITFISTNTPITANITEASRQIPSVHKIHNVLHYDNIPNSYAINVRALKKDNKGYFVWKGEGQKNFQPGKGLSQEFTIEKIYVIPDDNNVEQISPSDRIVKLKNAATLSFGDIVIDDPPEGAKRGDKVCFIQHRYILMPGDIVKVKIGPNQQQK